MSQIVKEMLNRRMKRVSPQQKRIEFKIADYLKLAIQKDFLIFVLITSHTQGKVKARNLPYGMGKTTLMMRLLYLLNGKDWDRVFELMFYNPYDLFCAFDPKVREKEGRINAVGYDDIQATAPAEQGVPKALRKFSKYVTTCRPEISILLGTADNITSISAPLRKIVLFEIIVWERGEYEVQKIEYHKDFNRPFRDRGRVEYKGESNFPKLPPAIQKRYNEWRADEKAKLYPSIKKELYAYIQLRDWSATEFRKSGMAQYDKHVVKSGDRYFMPVPKEIGKEMYQGKDIVNVILSVQKADKAKGTT